MIQNNLTLSSSTTATLLSPCRLKPLDIEFMKRLHEKVNVIPLIAKADTLTPEECQQFKKQVSSFPQLHASTLKIPPFFFYITTVSSSPK